ncbi:hypothetical protein M5X17_27685 [Paenibacillus alvei]|uniref:hypothetical protein n=1 Tax=Paenibacillus alvei TaxID=44250 RepID=UPI00228200C1|nr:hypothetical protein [Paenibacillus alvei]MCY9737488.1 hypothetical protein [Paenibacillus alvei]
MSMFLWEFYWDCGRLGSLNCLFVATEEEVNNIIGKEANFGEVLGKHSEIFGTIKDGDIRKIDVDLDAIEKISKILGFTWSGLNPLYYLSEDR